MKKDTVGSYRARREALRAEIRSSEYKMRSYAPDILKKSNPDLLARFRRFFHEAWVNRKTKREQLDAIARKKDR